MGHHGLVGSDNILAGFQCGHHIFLGRMQTADGFYNGIDAVVTEDILKIVGHLCIGQSTILAAKHFDYLHILSCTCQFINALAYSTEAKKTDSHKNTS